MKLMTCICGEGGTLNVQGNGYGRTIGRGAVVDFDAPVAPDRSETWGQAIGQAYAHLFEPADATPVLHRRRERPADVSEALAAKGARSDEVKE